jgi:hypothetical protein
VSPLSRSKIQKIQGINFPSRARSLILWYLYAKSGEHGSCRKGSDAARVPFWNRSLPQWVRQIPSLSQRGPAAGLAYRSATERDAMARDQRIKLALFSAAEFCLEAFCLARAEKVIVLMANLLCVGRSGLGPWQAEAPEFVISPKALLPEIRLHMPGTPMHLPLTGAGHRHVKLSGLLQPITEQVMKLGVYLNVSARFTYTRRNSP